MGHCEVQTAQTQVNSLETLLYLQSIVLIKVFKTGSFSLFSGNFARDLSGAKPSWLYLLTFLIVFNDASPT